MKNFEDFEIEFVGLKSGEHEYNYHIDEEFFELFEYNEFNAVDVDVLVLLEKQDNMLEFEFIVDGVVNVDCDVSNEPYEQAVNISLPLVVKFDSAYKVVNEELLILPFDEIRIEVQQYIYEAIILAVPQKKVHPGVIDGTLESEVLDKLEELSPGNTEEKEGDTDPRWDKLKDLLNQK